MTTDPTTRTTPAPSAGEIGDSGGTSTPAARQTLGSDAFLRLLVIKLQNQDPTNPQSDTDFIAQLATFSSLEQLTSINRAITDLSTALLDTPPTTSSTGSQSSTQKGKV